MWQPNRTQWAIIWIATLFVVCAWPPESGRSLLLKAAARAVDPADALPALPSPLPIGLDDDGDAVAAHDAQERDYYAARERSAVVRWRMAVKEAQEPFDPTTERQLLVAVAAVSALLVWRLNPRAD